MMKLSLLLPGALTVFLTSAPILPSIAQQPLPNPGVRQERRQANPLNLTEDQKERMKQIRQSTRARMEAVLTSEQKAQLAQLKADQQAARQQGQKPAKMKGAFASLNLTQQQKDQIRAIQQEAKQQHDAVLTPEQRRLKQEQQAARRQQRQQQQQQRQQPQ